jgi:hypothetical protein
MIFEKKWPDVAPRAFTSNGTAQGLVTLTSTKGFYVKQLVVLKAAGFQDKQLQIKRIISSTQMFLGSPDKGINHREDLSGYLLALTPFVYAVVQDRPSIAPADYERAVYAEEPIVAKRVVGVDEFGNYYNKDNPYPVFDIDQDNTFEHKVLNININANTDTPINLPNNISRFIIKQRNGRGPLKILDPYNPNNFYTIERGMEYRVDAIKVPNSYTINVNSAQDGTVEVICWVKI